MATYHGTRSFLRKLVITASVGALSFPLTNMLFDALEAQVAMTVGVGAVTLIIQLLIDVERRLSSAEAQHEENTAAIRQIVNEGFTRINEATDLFGRAAAAGIRHDTVIDLLRNAAKIDPDAPPLVSAFAQAEVSRTARFLRELADNEATYSGEDRDWLLALTRCATLSVDAISLTAVDAGGTSFDGGFWASDLGRRYLDQQREAVGRHVRVRRVFVVEYADPTEDPNLLRVLKAQAALGVQVRVLRPVDVPASLRSYLYDFILFDDELSYEVPPAPHFEAGENPLILHTRLVLDPAKVRERRACYTQLWKVATSIEAQVPRQQARRVSRRSLPEPT
ncbi:MAG: phosphatidylserine/phosphatidylglycerophosphate/cardiolipin synthase family protein [Actinomycetota bacterium]|nr:phosphatidylserine/phosphatidylglycerophosphate/cardiolipin synthase family protein [Actinomycetota bacterium]